MQAEYIKRAVSFTLPNIARVSPVSSEREGFKNVPHSATRVPLLVISCCLQMVHNALQASYRRYESRQRTFVTKPRAHMWGAGPHQFKVKATVVKHIARSKRPKLAT